MFFRTKEQRAKDREKNRFYLLPGQGGSAFHRKQMTFLKAALVVGLLVSALFAVAVYFANRR